MKELHEDNQKLVDHIIKLDKESLKFLYLRLNSMFHDRYYRPPAHTRIQPVFVPQPYYPQYYYGHNMPIPNNPYYVPEHYQGPSHDHNQQ